MTETILLRAEHTLLHRLRNISPYIVDGASLLLLLRMTAAAATTMMKLHHAIWMMFALLSCAACV
jgi:hypothetical protein